MKKQVKKLNLKKSTVLLIGTENKMMLQGGQPLPTAPAPTCGLPCKPSIISPCIPPPPR